MSVQATGYSHYDCGFNPRFSEDGNTYNFTNWGEKISLQSIFFVFHLALHTLRAVLSCGEERELRFAYLSSVYGELALSYCEKGHALEEGEKNYLYTRLSRTFEHQFYKKVDNLYRLVVDGTEQAPAEATARIFPSELLMPLHAINRHHNLRQRNITPGSLSNDLLRLVPYGFACLGPDGPGSQNPKTDHDAYIQATQESSAALTEGVRTYRSSLLDSVREVSVFSSSDVFKNRLRDNVTALKSVWDTYADSHEELKAVAEKLESCDPYAPFHESQQWRLIDTWVPECFENTLSTLFSMERGRDRTLREACSHQLLPNSGTLTEI